MAGQFVRLFTLVRKKFCVSSFKYFLSFNIISVREQGGEKTDQTKNFL